MKREDIVVEDGTEFNVCCVMNISEYYNQMPTWQKILPYEIQEESAGGKFRYKWISSNIKVRIWY